MPKNPILCLILLQFLTWCKGQNSSVDLSTVRDVDIEKYLGTWYEIARFDHKFERGLQGITATYSWRKDGKIKVVNAGFKKTLQGQRSESVGKAYIPDPTNPSKLKVSFFANFYGDYFILELDEKYQWAVVGSSSDKYLWILSRTPRINNSLYNELLERLTKRGYDVTQLIKVEQKNN